MTPTASLIIPSYRGRAKLPVLLEALRRQDTTDFEAVVVIDGRLDDSPALVEAASEALPVRAVVLEQNQGRVAALNAGLASARGEVLIRCDDDLEPAPGFVSGHIARHVAAPAPIGVVGIYKDRLPDNAYARAYGMPREYRFRRGAYTTGAPWRYWAGNCSISRATWEEIGAYSASYTHYGWEDVDYGYRLHEAGIPLVLAPELETIHHGAATTTVGRVLRAYHSGAARRTFESLHGAVLAPPSAGGGLWGRLVGATERLGGESRFEALARITDRVLPLVPAPIGEKLVALAVESASLAGYSSSSAVSARF